MDGIKVKISWDEVDNIVISQIKSVIEDILKDTWVFEHSFPKALESVDAALLTLRYFISGSEYEKYKLTIQEDYEQLVKLAEPLKVEDFV